MLLIDRAPATPAQILSFYCPAVRAPLRGNLLGITFDDGLLSSYYAAEQVLKPLGLKAFFFVPTQIFDLKNDAEMRDFFTTRVYRSGRTGLSPHHYQTMSRDHVRELHAQGHMVLPHTHSHVRLDEINENELVDRELVRPKALLEDMLQTKIEAFAFPFGTERVVSPFAFRAVRQTYDACFAGVGGPNTAQTDRYSLHRDCVHPHFSRRCEQYLSWVVRSVQPAQDAAVETPRGFRAQAVRPLRAIVLTSDPSRNAARFTEHILRAASGDVNVVGAIVDRGSKRIVGDSGVD